MQHDLTLLHVAALAEAPAIIIMKLMEISLLQFNLKQNTLQ